MTNRITSLLNKMQFLHFIKKSQKTIPEEKARAYLASSNAARVASKASRDGFPYLPYKNSPGTSAVPDMIKLEVIVIGGTTDRLQSQFSLKLKRNKNILLL